MKHLPGQEMGKLGLTGSMCQDQSQELCLLEVGGHGCRWVLSTRHPREPGGCPSAPTPDMDRQHMLLLNRGDAVNEARAEALEVGKMVQTL